MVPRNSKSDLPLAIEDISDILQHLKIFQDSILQALHFWRQNGPEFFFVKSAPHTYEHSVDKSFEIA